MSFASFIKKKTKYFWLYFILGGVLLVASVCFAPLWENTDTVLRGLGSKVIYLLLGALLLLYFFAYLLKKICKRTYRTVKILWICEAVLFVLLALGCLIEQFSAFSFGSPFQLVGLCLLSHGVLDCFRSYFYKQDASIVYPFWALVLSLFFVILGTYLMVKPPLSALALTWILAGTLFLCSVVSVVLGVVKKG